MHAVIHHCIECILLAVLPWNLQNDIIAVDALDASSIISSQLMRLHGPAPKGNFDSFTTIIAGHRIVSVVSTIPLQFRFLQQAVFLRHHSVFR